MAQKTPEIPETSKAPVSPSDGTNGVGSKADYRSVLIHPDNFAHFKSIQKSQQGSPKFDLGDLITAALNLVQQEPNHQKKLHEQAVSDFKKRV
jgi:hypothetical protein